MGFRIAKSQHVFLKAPSSAQPIHKTIPPHYQLSTLAFIARVIPGVRTGGGDMLWILWNLWILQTGGLYCHFQLLTVYILVLQLVPDPCKDPRLHSPPVVQWQRGETWSPPPLLPPPTRKCLQCLASGTSQKPQYHVTVVLTISGVITIKWNGSLWGNWITAAGNTIQQTGKYALSYVIVGYVKIYTQPTSLLIRAVIMKTV